MAWLVQLLGIALILLALVDVFLMVLYARSGVGLITPRLNRTTWRLMRRIAPGRSPARDVVLSYGGPIILVLTVAVWAALLFLGSGLIAWPELGTGVRATSGTTPTDFVTALYYGGYSLTTLGTGNLVPETGALKLLMVILALVGFSFVTLTITYFMSVYSALLRRNKLAQSLHQGSGGSGDAAGILLSAGPGGDFRAGSGQLSQIGRDVIDLLESHHLYPVLHYFRMLKPRYSTARVVMLTLDTASLARCALGSSHRDFAGSGAIQILWGSGLELLDDTTKTFISDKSHEKASRQSDEEEARHHYRSALRKLSDGGIETAEDPALGEEEYLELRGQWITRVRALAQFTGYRWNEISPVQQE